MKIAGPVGAMGQRVLQPIVNQQVANVLAALEKQVRGEAAEGAEADPSAREAHRSRRTPRRRLTEPWPSRSAIGVMQLTMEPLDEMLASARVMDEAGMDTIWLAEAYPVVAQAPDGGALVDRRLRADGARDGAADDRLGDHLAVHAPPGAGGDGRTGRAGGRRPGPVHPRLRDVEDLPQQHPRRRRRRRSGRCATRSTIVRGVLGGERVRVRGRDVERRRAGALAPRRTRRATCRPSTSPRRRRRCRRSRGEIADGCLTPSITTPAFVRYTRENVARRHRHRLHGRRLDRRGPRRRAATGRARSPACTSRTRCRTSRARPTRCSSSPGSSRRRSARSPRRWSAGGRLAAKAEVTDAILDKCKPIAGTPADCIAAIEEYRDAGCTHVMLELWGDQPARPDPALRREGAAALPL